MKFESVIDPNFEIQNLQNEVLEQLNITLPKSIAELVGAMAVPMAGRSEIDLMVLSGDIDHDSDVLSSQGYVRGPVVNGISYFKKVVGNIEVGVQIMSPDNHMVNIHRTIVLRLREDRELRESYENFKRSISGLTNEEYKRKKKEWIDKNLLVK